MSCTIMSIPFAIAWVANAIILPAAAAAAAKKNKKNNEIEQICEDTHLFDEETLLTNTLETPFNDAEVLVKTLEEHGVEITEHSEYKIVGTCDRYILSFEKNDAGKPFYLTAKYDNEKVFSETLNDINNEYSVNVQESTYLSIIEKLKENDLEIAEEEVLDDNTIVLTVNLE